MLRQRIGNCARFVRDSRFDLTRKTHSENQEVNAAPRCLEGLLVGALIFPPLRRGVRGGDHACPIPSLQASIVVDTLVAGKDRNAVRAEFENLKTKKKWQIW